MLYEVITERHCCFLNTRGPVFANVSAVSGLDLIDDGRGLALVDWDHDGDLDAWISNRNAPRLRLLRNNSDTSNRFLVRITSYNVCYTKLLRLFFPFLSPWSHRRAGTSSDQPCFL